MRENDLPRLARRDVLRAGATVAGLSALSMVPNAASASDSVDEVDYVVIGSGPGGAPLAARLVEAGYEVMVLEAGPPHGNDTWYQVPSLQPRAAAADKLIRWDYYVKHYSDDAYGKTSRQWVAEQGGILYPRASTLGGCTAHHNMITFYPEHSDWAYIQRLTGDDSWAPDEMWRHWEEGVLGWQSVEFGPLEALIVDPQLGALQRATKAEAATLEQAIVKDPRGLNKRPHVDHSAQGFFYTPQSTFRGRRVGPRERLQAAANDNPRRLIIETDALAERIVLEQAPDGRQRAVAVEYLKGSHLYGASPLHKQTSKAERTQLRRSVRARREVIVAGGVYSSPQLLMLSGIGPAGHLAEHGIPVKIDLPGVGTNLQDRYEVPVVTEHRDKFLFTAACTFGEGFDPCLALWQGEDVVGFDKQMGFYGGNGVIAGIKRRYGSDPRAQLYVLGTPSQFRGYVPNFDSGLSHNHFTWLILKGFAESRAGTVRLRSADPTRPPLINKRNFNDGTAGKRDVEAIVDTVELMRRVNKRAGTSGTEVWPGPDVKGQADLTAWVRREAWGHHASCTNPIGHGSDNRAVLDSRFRVHGTTNLRVVDASAFPRIPGLFIWAPIAIISEKAASDILAADA